MMNFVLSKLKSLLDNFSHISYWRNSWHKTHAKGFTIFKMPNPGAWFYILEKVKFQTVVFGFTYH